MPKKKEELVEILLEAKRNALNSIGNDDGGSANFDKTVVFGESGSDFIEACNKAGLQCNDYGKQGINIQPPDFRWQGYNRTRQIEAITKTLEKKGIKAYNEYHMD